MKPHLAYHQNENHVEKRSCLSPVMRASMFDVPRQAWRSSPRFRGEPEHWTQIHKALLSASASLASWTEQFSNNEDDARRAVMATQISDLGHRLVHHAHSHHHIEDHYFFPVFLRLHPQLQHPLELLDGDHKVLAEVLDDLERAVAAFPVDPAGGDRDRRDAWLKAGEAIGPAAKRLDSLFVRHINDEEEICIPIMLQL
jgi:hypothetical protein